MFRELGPNARGLLGVIAFYPQGIHENNVNWLFPTIPNGTRILDKFCFLSLTHRSNGFITMLAPLRGHLRPKDPKLSTLLCTEERYFARISVPVGPSLPGFEDTQWTSSEDVNFEHILDVVTTINPDSDDVWNTCVGFKKHLHWHKPRQTMLEKKIEGFPDRHLSRPQGLQMLAFLFGVLGYHAEKARLLNHALKLGRERGDDLLVGKLLESLSDANRMLSRYKEGIDQAREVLEIYERFGKTPKLSGCLNVLAQLLKEDGQLDAAEEAMLESMKLLPEEVPVCRAHHALGDIYRSKGERGKAIYQYEVALGVASYLSHRDFLFWVHHALADGFLDEDEFDKAQVHAEQTKSCTFNDPYNLGLAVHLQARIWYRQHRFEDAASEAQRAQVIFMLNIRLFRAHSYFFFVLPD